MIRSKWKFSLFVIVFIVLFSYTLTSINSWTFYNRVGEFTEYTYVKMNQMTLIGKSFAPFQYRILQPLLVELVFRHIAIPWRDDMGETIEKGFKTDEALTTLLNPTKSKVASILPSKDAFNRNAVAYLRNSLIKLNVDPKYRFFFLLVAPTVNWYEKVRTIGSTSFRVLDTLLPGFSNVDKSGTYEYSTVNGAITSEFIYTILTMFFLFLILRRFVDRKYAFIGLLMFSATLPLTFNVTAPESSLALMLVTIGFYMIVKDVRPGWILFLVTIGSFARADQMLFVALVYLLNQYFKEKARRELSKIWSGVAVCVIPFAVMAILMFVLFPNTPDNYPLSNIIYNFTNPWAYVYVLTLFNVELLFLSELFKHSFYRKTVIALAIFLFIDLVGGMVEEVRILMPAYIYMLPATMMGLKKLFSEVSYEQ